MTTFLEIEELPRTMVVDIVRSVIQIYNYFFNRSIISGVANLTAHSFPFLSL